MKKNLSVVLYLCLIPIAMTAQTYDLTLTGGYCLPIASSYNYSNATEYQIYSLPVNYAANTTVAKVSYGQGGALDLGFNWFSKRGFGCGLKLDMHFSTPFYYNSSVTYDDGSIGNFTFKYSAFSFQFAPHICFRHDFRIVSPVIELGMIAGINNISDNYQDQKSTGDFVQSTVHEKGGVMLGFYSSLGLEFKVTKFFKIMVTLDCSAASYSPTAWDRTSYIYDNINQTSYLPPSYAHGVYVTQLNQAATQPTNQPSQSLKYSAPFSNVGFKVGFAFVFGKKKIQKGLLGKGEPEAPAKPIF